MRSKAQPIILDRLDHALKAHGVSLKRAQVLEIAASSFGYHNSNEFTAAAKRGEIDAQPATPVGRIDLGGESIVVLRDPVAGAPYAIDEAFLDQAVEDERRERYGPSPYGHLLDLSAIGDTAIASLSTGGAGPGKVSIDVKALKTLLNASTAFVQDQANGFDGKNDDGRPGPEDVMAVVDVGERASAAAPASASRREGGTPERVTVKVAMVAHRHGRDCFVGGDEAEMREKIAAYVHNSWDDAIERIIVMDEKYSGGIDDDVTELTYEGETIPRYPNDIADDEAIRLYFHVMTTIGEEWIDYSDATVSVEALGLAGMPSRAAAPSPAPKAPAPAKATTGDQFVIGYVPPKKEGGAQLWWSNDDGWGELSDATVFEDMNGNLPTAGMDASRIGWYQLPDPKGNAGSRDPWPAGFRFLTNNDGEGGGDEVPANVRALIDDTFLEIPNSWMVASGYVAKTDKGLFMAPTIDLWHSNDHEKAKELEVELHLYKHEVEDAVRALGGDVVYEGNEPEGKISLTFLIPINVALRAPSKKNWHAALVDLLTPRGWHGKRVTAEFTPQAWVNDYATTVDAEGDREFDVTFEVLLMGRKEALKIRDNEYESDDLRFAVRAPEWIREWGGPHVVSVEDSIREFFDEEDVD